MIIFDENTHTYFDKDGNKLISVTTLLAKHGLTTNYSNVDEEILRKKAERGTYIHSEVEEHIKEGKIGFTVELMAFIKLCEDAGLKPTESEMKAARGHIAGTIDLQGVDENGLTFIGDLKTTYKLNKEACRWQLSLYAWLLNKRFDKFLIFHFGKDDNKIVEIEPIPLEEIERLVDCDLRGITYTAVNLIANEEAVNEIELAELRLKRLLIDVEQAKETADKLRAALLAKMQENGIKSIDTELLKLTVVDSYTKNAIDSTRLKAEKPEIYADYLKTSVVKASLKVTIK